MWAERKLLKAVALYRDGKVSSRASLTSSYVKVRGQGLAGEPRKYCPWWPLGLNSNFNNKDVRASF